MHTDVQKFVLRVAGQLTTLQSIDLTSYNPKSSEAKEILARFLVSAAEGDAYAMTICAACYRSGWGAECDASKSFHWAKLAAQTNFPPGIAELGYSYQEGIGTPQNIESALLNLNRAVEAGYGQAAIDLAICYSTGTPYGRSPDKAVEYAEMAFQMDEPYAANLLGQWHEEGKIVPFNVDAARSWYEIAAARGSQLACLRMATAYLNGELGLSRDATKYQKFIELSAHGSSF